MTYKTTYWDTESQSQQERDCTPEEIAEIEARKAAAAAAAPNQLIYDQITALEEQQTARLIREAALGGDYALEKLTDIETAIQALRDKLL